jgi:diacylglycerol kinase (ATP)
MAEPGSAFPAPRSALILNPAAGNGRAEREWPALAEKLRAAGITFKQMVTCGPGDATLLAQQAVAEGAERLIVVGGDGTLNEAVNGCLDDAGGVAQGAPELALVPLGTGSDFARGLGIPGGAAAIEVLLHGHPQPLDLGLATYRDAQGREVTRAFANVADFGLGPETSALIALGSTRLGPAAYFLGALQAIAAFTPTPIRVEVDGATVYDGPSGMAVVANGSYFGGGMQVAPHAQPDDGEFEILVLDCVGRRTLVTDILPRIYRGTHIHHMAVHQARGRTVTIDATTPFPLELDGEIVGATPARFTLLPGALRVLVPEGQTA